MARFILLLLLVESFLFFSSFVDCSSAKTAFDDFGITLETEDSNGRVKRQQAKLGTMWNGGQVNYYFRGSKNERREKIMRTAMDYISNRTCIKFVENPNAGQRIRIENSDLAPCQSKVGAPGSRANSAAEEPLFFGGCSYMMGVAAHELSHSLGSFHEHNRPERDSYIIVNQSEVQRTRQQDNFRLQPWGMSTHYVPFDYGSCLMYTVHQYGMNMMKATYPEYTRTMGNRRITFYDIDRINKYYGCSCPVELPCYNGGYTSPGDCSRCFCPKGYFGKLCNERACTNSYELTAQSGWQSTNISFSFVDNGDNHAYYSSSFAYVNAPANKTIEIKIDQLNEIVCMSGCNSQGVEIKTVPDNKLTSPIVCCAEEELAKKTFTTTNNPTIIEMFSKEGYTSSVKFSYRFV